MDWADAGVREIGLAELLRGELVSCLATESESDVSEFMIELRLTVSLSHGTVKRSCGRRSVAEEVWSRFSARNALGV